MRHDLLGRWPNYKDLCFVYDHTVHKQSIAQVFDIYSFSSGDFLLRRSSILLLDVNFARILVGAPGHERGVGRTVVVAVTVVGVGKGGWETPLLICGV